MKRVIITLSLLTALSLPAIAAEQGERPERPQRPDPAEVATDWVTKYDANGNGSLEEVELTAAFTAARENRPPRPQIGNRQGQRQRGPQGGERPEREPGQMLSTMIERFDKDGDAALNEGELKEALTAMHKMQRRGPRGPRGMMPNRGQGRAPNTEATNEG
ncbi:MAG: hypothetical protein AB3N63_17110 [Puniceicoccaceae bacterium]